MSTMVPRHVWSDGRLAVTDPRLRPLAVPAPVVVIHHTGAGPTVGSDAIVRGLHSYATRSKLLGGKGLMDLQYHYLVDERGTIWQGRANARPDVLAEGAHAPGPKGSGSKGLNDLSVAVCVLGDYRGGRLGEPALDAIGRLLGLLRWGGYVRPDVLVVPHSAAGEVARRWGRTAYATVCPGGVAVQVQEIRRRAGL